MELANFQSLCSALGDQALAEKDRWKSIKYISIAGQATPGFDFQKMLKDNRIFFLSNDTIGAGFCLLDSANSDMGITNINDPVLSFIPLKVVDAVTFIVTKKSDTGEPLSIYELTEGISSEAYDIPVVVRFPHSVFYFKKGEPIKIPVVFSRSITDDNYDIIYLDSNSNEIDAKPTDIGSYYLHIKCKDGYIGQGITRFEIQ